jgi:hypothetical protein
VCFVFEPPREPGWDARGLLTAITDGLSSGTALDAAWSPKKPEWSRPPGLAWWYLGPMLKRGHQNWIENLKSKAEAGEP